MRKNIHDIGGRKGPDASPLVCLTAYTAQMASLLDPHCDMILVGDSVAMVVYGHPSTLQADLDMMIRHGQAVMRGAQNALVVVDMPFGSYQESPAQAFRNAALILKETQAQAVKIEGGAEMADTIAYLTARGVPVVGHVGLMPQSFNTLGGYKAQGRDDKTAEKIMTDAKAVANSGAFAIVIEGVAEGLAARITRAVSCPTIGIGASAECDGQILVCDDMLGITQGKKPKFVKEYANLGAGIDAAAAQYAKEVTSRQFPDAKYLYSAPKPAADSPNAPAPAAQISTPDQQDNNRPSASGLILRAIRPKS